MWFLRASVGPGPFLEANTYGCLSKKKPVTRMLLDSNGQEDHVGSSIKKNPVGEMSKQKSHW
jgi:hypothetical protein